MDLIFGLPVHPLINHAVAVLVPLSAVGVVLLILVPKFRSAYSKLLFGFIGAAAISGLIAENSGEALAKRVGTPGSHAQNGELLSKVILLLAVMYLVWYFINYKTYVFKSASVYLKNFVSGTLLVVAVVSAGLTFLVGHSGAAATWEGRIATGSGEAISEGQVQGSVENTPSPSAGEVILSVAEIRNHNTKGDCWSLIKGDVYNLTSYVRNHPGGQDVISNICGKDGSSAFSNQHGSSRKPNNVLNGLLIGKLGAVVTQSEVTVSNETAKTTGKSYVNEEEDQEDD